MSSPDLNQHDASHDYHHTTWSSSWGFIFAATGAAVGLGNIWKFPYMAGDNGGAPFVFIYLLAILFVGLPLFLGELLLGRLGRANPVNTLTKLAKQNNCSLNWRFAGWWGALALLLTLSFYSVVASWSVAYFFKYLSLTLGINSQSLNLGTIEANWHLFLGAPGTLLYWHTIFMLLTISVVMLGVTKGIERASNIMTPFLFIILFLLAIYSACYGDFKAGLKFLFHVDFSKINSTVIIDALGHAFFTLALGAGCMLTYGAYLPANTSIVKSMFIITALDVLVAFLSGMAIFPIVFANGLDPAGGPDLMFKVLPMAFLNMPASNFIGCLFFLLLTVAAWTSSISLVEPIAMTLIERYGYSRISSCATIGCIAWLLGILSLLSFNECQDVLILGKWNFFTLITDLTTNIMLPIGGLLFAVFTGWKLDQKLVKSVLQEHHSSYIKIWQFLIRYVSPAAIFIILFNSLI